MYLITSFFFLFIDLFFCILQAIKSKHEFTWEFQFMIDSHSIPYDAVFHSRISVRPGLVSLISKFSYVYHNFFFFFKSRIILYC